jgi:hypothetical protein
LSAHQHPQDEAEPMGATRSISDNRTSAEANTQPAEEEEATQTGDRQREFMWSVMWNENKRFS